MSLQLRILTPVGAAVEDTPISTITATGLEGEFGVLEGHLPFLTALKTGPLTFQEKGGKHQRYFALGEGFAEVYDNTVTLFVESAEEAPNIDAERAQDALKRADEQLAKLGSLAADHPDLLRYNRARSRALTRIEIAKEATRYKTY